MWKFLSLPEPIEAERESLVRAACAPLPRGKNTRRRAREERDTARAALRSWMGPGGFLFFPELLEAPSGLLSQALDWGWVLGSRLEMAEREVLDLFSWPIVHAGDPLPALSRLDVRSRALLFEGEVAFPEEVGLTVGGVEVARLAQVLLGGPATLKSDHPDLNRRVWLDMHRIRNRHLRSRQDPGIHVLLMDHGGVTRDQHCGEMRASSSEPGFSEVTPALPGTLEIEGVSLERRLKDWEGLRVGLWLGGPPPLTPDILDEASRWVL